MADTESLTEVEPSPVDETPAQYEGESYFPPQASSGRSTNFLGLTDGSTIRYLNNIQRYSSYAFTAFAAAHITNTSIIPLITQSVPASESYLLLTRPYYQGIHFEPLLIIVPAYAHVLSGLAIRLYRRRLNAKRYGDSDYKKVAKSFFSGQFWPVVSGISKLGYIFSPLLLGHAIINRAVPNSYPGGSSNVNLSYVSHAFAKHPAISYAGFSALLTVGCWHIVWGWSKWLGLTPEQSTATGGERELQKKRRWYIINGLAAAVTGLWMAGSFGVLARAGPASGWVGRQYDEMYRKVPVVGRWL